ncbi:hypothetical protein MC885_021270 [Smutsia gigantea]|nr:hypothetical protein MC885_021270 [Smutsia gigantea]
MKVASVGVWSGGQRWAFRKTESGNWLDNDVLLNWAPVEEAGDSTQILFSKKDASGGDSCTSEEEPTFDPGYEPDWAVISTVRPQPRHSEPSRGRLSWGPGGR